MVSANVNMTRDKIWGGNYFYLFSVGIESYLQYCEGHFLIMAEGQEAVDFHQTKLQITKSLASQHTNAKV